MIAMQLKEVALAESQFNQGWVAVRGGEMKAIKSIMRNFKSIAYSYFNNLKQCGVCVNK